MNLFPWAAFILAFVSGFMTWIARYVWQDRKKTQTWAAIGIVSTMAFMIWALFYSGL